MFGLQNGEPIGDDLNRLADLWELGLRVFQLTYNQGNQLADGCTEARDGGLTDLGRGAVKECNRLGMLVDLSHVGRRSCLDAVEASSVPVAVTHANRRALVDNPRNKPDDVLLAVAEAGGVIGVTPWAPMCWRGGGAPDFEDFIAQLTSVLELVGVDSVAIGSDLAVVTAAAPPSAAILERSAASHPEIFAAYVAAVDNTIETRYCRGFQSVSRWSQLPDDLAALGLSDEDRAKVLGGNWLRLLAGVLPSAREEAA
jgi:membrane dipeptidase